MTVRGLIVIPGETDPIDCEFAASLNAGELLTIPGRTDTYIVRSVRHLPTMIGQAKDFPRIQIRAEKRPIRDE